MIANNGHCICNAAKKAIYLMAVPLRGGVGVKRLPLRSFGKFFFNLLKKFRLSLSLRGRGDKTLMALPLRTFFLRLP